MVEYGAGRLCDVMKYRGRAYSTLRTAIPVPSFDLNALTWFGMNAKRSECIPAQSVGTRARACAGVDLNTLAWFGMNAKRSECIPTQSVGTRSVCLV